LLGPFFLNFSDLPIDHRIVKNLTTMQLSELTEVQQQAISHALLGKDIIAASKTGSGKTLAFVVPMVNRLLTQRSLSKADARALILAPTRELAKQVYGVCRQVIANTQLQATLIVGGENYNDQAKLLKRNPQILVATAGRMADHLKDRHIYLHGLELLILDEADRMLELGFAEQLKAVHEQADHRKRQTMMFSATIEQAQVKAITQTLLKSPQRIVVDSAEKPHQDIMQKFYYSDGVSQKDEQLLSLLSVKNQEQVIVFTATRNDTLRITAQLEALNVSAVALNGELLQKQRSQVLESFSQNKHTILVTTDLAARGLDIRNVALVINYDLPKFPEEYIHRIGRTGRAGNKGVAISIVSKKDWNSFESIKANYLQAVEFSTIDGITTRFKGVKPLPKTRKVVKKPSVNKPADNKKAPKKRFKTMDSVDLGNVPIKRKARANPDDIDNEPDS
jgi:superfamily II DNA/RNA helicase